MMRIFFLMIISISSLFSQHILILGVAQDAGAPQAMCKKSCCKERWEKGIRHYATSLALVDDKNKTFYMFEATPDFKYQYRELEERYPDYQFGGIFLTHAHIGHYAGLIQLGHEVVGTKNVPVYVMPVMSTYFSENGPWSQLVEFKNITLMNMVEDQAQKLSGDMTVTPFRVPHRDEFSETVGYEIMMNGKSIIFIPDIDKWDVWDTSIVEVVKKADLSILDGTFYGEHELPGRNMSEIKHPFIVESLATFKDLSIVEKSRIMFIHFNHTNPLLEQASEEARSVKKAGYRVAVFGEKVEF